MCHEICRNMKIIIDIGEYNTPSMKKDTIENIIPKKARQNWYKLIKNTFKFLRKSFKYLLS